MGVFFLTPSVELDRGARFYAYSEPQPGMTQYYVAKASDPDRVSAFGQYYSDPDRWRISTKPAGPARGLLCVARSSVSVAEGELRVA